ncbi:MAG TPA: hypothetical protein VG755_40100 [Nannocystaceae bacterium]|nr:hypothetical protein [Nannocystaceae bacterium]
MGPIVALALGCGDRVAPAAAATPVCGEPGPHLLLPLPEHEYVERVETWHDTTLLLATVAYDTSTPPKAIARRLFATEPCGDDARELGDDLELADVDDTVLACDGDLLLRIDPSGGDAVAIVDDVLCAGWVSDAGVLAVKAIDDAWGTLLMADFDGAAPPRTLVPAVRLPTASPPAANPFALEDGRVLLLTPDAELQSLDVARGELATVREGVADFRASDDLAWVLVQAGVPDDPDLLAIGAIALVNLADGTEHALLDARLSWTRLAFYGPYVSVRAQSWGDERLFRRDDGEAIAWPEGASLRHVLADERVIYAVGSGDWRDVDLRIFDPTRGTHTQLLRGEALLSFAKDGLERFTPDGTHGLQLGRLTLIPWDGGAERELVAHIAWPYVRRDDGTILSLRDDDGDQLGQLRAYTAEGDARELARDAYLHDPSLSRGQPFAPDVVFHGARDDARGLWRVHVSP